VKEHTLRRPTNAPLVPALTLVVLALLAASPLTAGDTLYRSPGNVEYGVVGPTGRFLDKGCYVACYCDEWRTPYWSAYYLNKDSLFGSRRRLEKYFQPDTLIPEEYRSVKADYQGSGFDRGHLAPAADFKRRPDAYVATFLLSNVSPQRGKTNRLVCAEIEDSLRRVVKRAGEAWIVVGNTMLDSTGRRSGAVPDSNWIRRAKSGVFQKRIAVPTHVFRAALVRRDRDEWQAWAFLVPNTNSLRHDWSIADYRISVDSLERVTGLDFFKMLDAAVQNRIESRVDWQW
jgi:endonuclease G